MAGRPADAASRLDLGQGGGLGPLLVVDRHQGYDRHVQLGQAGERQVLEDRLDRSLEGMRPDRRHDVTRGHLDDGLPGGVLLVGIPVDGIPRPPVGQVGVHRGEHLGRFGQVAQEFGRGQTRLGGDVLPTAVDQDEPGAAVAQQVGRPRGHDRTVAVPGQDHPAARTRGSVVEQPRPFGDRHHVLGQGRRVVLGGRCVGQAVTPQIGGHRRHDGSKPAGHRGPVPGRPAQAVDEQDAVTAGHRRTAPVEEVDPLPWRELDHETVRGRCSVRVGCLGGELGRLEVHPA